MGFGFRVAGYELRVIWLRRHSIVIRCQLRVTGSTLQVFSIINQQSTIINPKGHSASLSFSGHLACGRHSVIIGHWTLDIGL